MSFSFPLHLHIFSPHTSPLAQPGSGDAGGMNVYIERSLAALLEVNPQLTVEVFTLATDRQQAGQVRYHERATVTALYLPEAEGARKEDLPELVPGFAMAVRAIASRPPQLIHSHYWLSGLAALAAYPQVPLVHTMHTTAAAKNARLGEGERPEPEVRLRGEQALVRRAAALVVNTEYEATQMRDFYGAQESQLVTVAPGVDLSVFSPSDGLRPLHEGQDGAAHLVFAGRPQHLKGPHLLVEALGLLPGELDVTLDIIGTSGTSYEQSLATRAEELGLGDRVRLLPSMTAPDLAQAFRKADIVACPSSSETFGLVALEASACGTPVLASKVDGLREAVADGVTGLLVAQRTPAAWADAIEQLVKDPQLRHALGQAGARRAHDFTWQATAQALIQLYQSLARS
ncbi:glycosyltransferase [Rothia nasimurium]